MKVADDYGISTSPRPNGVIKACFERKSHMYDGKMSTTDQILRDDFMLALEKWRERGLEFLKWEFVADDGYCAENEENREHRHEFVLIKYTEKQIMHSSVGKQQKKIMGTGDLVVEGSRPTWEDLGGVMTVTKTPGIGTGNFVSTFAHEIGHTLGLYHEHQNPAWWRFQDYGGDIADGPGYGDDTFHCHNLWDYAHADDFAKKVIEDRSKEPGGPAYTTELKDALLRKFCTKHAMAKVVDKGFSATAFLPEPHFAWTSPRRTDPDYRSIMTYPSRMNGLKENGVGRVVLRKWDLTLLDPVLDPSEEDISAVRRLYGIKEPETAESTSRSRSRGFLGDKLSVWKENFDRARSRSRGRQECSE